MYQANDNNAFMKSAQMISPDIVQGASGGTPGEASYYANRDTRPVMTTPTATDVYNATVHRDFDEQGMSAGQRAYTNLIKGRNQEFTARQKGATVCKDGQCCTTYMVSSAPSEGTGNTWSQAFYPANKEERRCVPDPNGFLGGPTGGQPPSPPPPGNGGVVGPPREPEPPPGEYPPPVSKPADPITGLIGAVLGGGQGESNYQPPYPVYSTSTQARTQTSSNTTTIVVVLAALVAGGYYVYTKYVK